MTATVYFEVHKQRQKEIFLTASLAYLGEKCNFTKTHRPTYLYACGAGRCRAQTSAKNTRAKRLATGTAGHQASRTALHVVPFFDAKQSDRLFRAAHARVARVVVFQPEVRRKLSVTCAGSAPPLLGLHRG